MAQAKKNSPKYVYDLPYFERMELCRILDQNDKWEELGGIYMQFDVLTIQTLRREVLRGNSPADELLIKWGHQNHTILELFVLLSKMQHYQAMLIIKQFVDPEYHRLIYEGEQNLSRMFKLKSAHNSNINLQLCNHIGTSSVEPNTKGQNNHSVINKMKKNGSLNSERLQSNVEFYNRNPDVRVREKKILNTECELQPEEVAAMKNSNEQTMLMSKESNQVVNEAADLLKPKDHAQKEESGRDRNISEISSIAESVGILPVITFKELEVATNGWDQGTILGKGGFGTVYKGIWKNTQVAIKRTKNSDSDENRSAQIQQILGELKMLNSYRHDNILPLYGFSMGAEEPCLIYQYMPNGSLEDRLLCRQGTKPLSWFQRHNIATGTARGLQFLHTIGEKPLIHGDIKSANILLDSNFEPKIGDFGLAREGPYNHYTHMKVSKVHGTRPYLPDEFLRHKKFSTKVDTYSFGIVLFELATGLRAYDDQRIHKFLKDLIESLDDLGLAQVSDKKCGADEHLTFLNLINLGKTCTSRKPKDRPEMVSVLQELNSMAVKRNAIVKVQNLIKQNSFSPLNPHEIQVLCEHLSQQKKISPSSSVSAIHRATGHGKNETNIALAHNNNNNNSANNNNNKNNNNNPFVPSDPLKNTLIMHHEELRPVSPSMNTNCHSNALEPRRSIEKLSEGDPLYLLYKNQNINNADPRQAIPVISVSPPSAPHSSSTSEDNSFPQQHETTQNEEYEYHYSSQFDNVLPLISELGIKTKSNEKNQEENPNSQHIDTEEITTTAKGKKLWILHDSN